MLYSKLEGFEWDSMAFHTGSIQTKPKLPQPQHIVVLKKVKGNKRKKTPLL